MEDTNLSKIYKETLALYLRLKHGKVKMTTDELVNLQERHNAVVQQLDFLDIPVVRYNFFTIPSYNEKKF